MPFKSLNAKQLEAVTYRDGPLLILAGAGSGKTKVLTSRIAYLVLERSVGPENILAVTFTNKAAAEMRQRLRASLGDKASRVWLGTFHSIGLRILRQEAAAAKIKDCLTVYGDDDQLSLIKEVLSELNLSDKATSAKAVATRINQAKNENIWPSEYLSYANDFFSERVAKIYSLYQKRLLAQDAADFGDLILRPIRLLRDNAELLKAYQERFSHILVDEYQDTNKAQYILTNLLASNARNIFAVGDPDQSIYGWRGADIKNILDFNRDYHDGSVIRLEQNYRSTAMILKAANSVIENNLKRMKKALWTENPEGRKVIYREAGDEYIEADYCIATLKGLMAADKAVSYRDAAVFYRTNAQSRVFEERLIREGIPYTVVGGVRFYDRKEIRDAVAYLRFAANLFDAVSFKRVVNTPARKLGPAAIERVYSIAGQGGLNLLDAVIEAGAKGLLKNTNAVEFINAVKNFRAGQGNSSLHERTLKLLEDAGYMRMFQDEGTEEAYERIENLFEFISAIKDFEAANPGAALPDFLDHVSLISDIDLYKEETDRLTLMTMHSAKGLEFKAVFLTGMEEGLFPHMRSFDDPAGLEEERRLCYVGMTRAKERLILTSARQRAIYGEPERRKKSRFIDEIPPDVMDMPDAEPSAYIHYDRPLPEPSCPVNDSRIEYDPESCGAAWRIGMKVVHPAFGVGVIKDRSGRGDEIKLTVSFSNAGVKKLAVRYAHLVRG
ncbi:MAG: UvrD-helicase domain-containing protein [Deltaproteobacteria bacterium]|nr:UvrD-helicase domain-containing protein [Deltaproteobacteria bacterium]